MYLKKGVTGVTVPTNPINIRARGGTPFLFQKCHTPSSEGWKIMDFDPIKMQEKLYKLRRNRHQMTPEQRRQYAKNLQNFCMQVNAECNAYLLIVLSEGLWVMNGDEKEAEKVVLRAGKIGRGEWWKNQLKEMHRALFARYSIEEFMSIAYRLRIEIWCKAYGPYWARRTKTDPDTGKMTNDLVDSLWGGHYVWSGERGQWESADGTSCTIMLPPTLDLIEKVYREEVAAYDIRKTGGI